MLSQNASARSIPQSDHLTLGQRSGTRRSHTLDHSAMLRTRSTAGASVSTCSADLSHRVNRVKEGIDDIKGQLREILHAKRQHTITSTPRSLREPVPQPPQRYLDFERELRRAEPQFDTHKGKDTIRDFFVGNPIPRPYMFLEGPGFRTRKDKLAHQDKMTFPQYVLAFTNMLMGECQDAYLLGSKMVTSIGHYMLKFNLNECAFPYPHRQTMPPPKDRLHNQTGKWYARTIMPGAVNTGILISNRALRSSMHMHGAMRHWAAKIPTSVKTSFSSLRTDNNNHNTKNKGLAASNYNTSHYNRPTSSLPTSGPPRRQVFTSAVIQNQQLLPKPKNAQ